MRKRQPRQVGFTLVEFAIVLIIIGLLFGLVIKGQELMNSARVRTLANTSGEVQAAYLGFIDRYHRVPGDWQLLPATAALGVGVVGGGNGNGRIDSPAGAQWDEPNALWEHLSKSGFLPGRYLGTPGVEPDVGNGLAPVNDFGGVVTVGITDDFQDRGSPGVRRFNIGLGRGIPARILLELDTKLDDGVADSGRVRAAAIDGAVSVFSGSNDWGGMVADCVSAGPPMRWGIASDAQDCNGVVLF